MNKAGDESVGRRDDAGRRTAVVGFRRTAGRPALALLILAEALTGFVPTLGSPHAATAAAGDKRAPVLYLVGQDPCDRGFEAVSQDTTCHEPNLVIVTHGWYEHEPWPAQLALAIRERSDGTNWRCGWYDWRQKARRVFPADAAKVARDEAGPLLGHQILSLSRHWRHVHLIGHSAGSWVANEAARTVAEQTSASIHLTFLDAYVPQGWDPQALGAPTGNGCRVYWAEHYFTRGRLEHLTESILTHAHNVDITDINPGFDSHNFPRHWYYATVLNRYSTRKKRLAGNQVIYETDGVPYGYLRTLEAGPDCWKRSVTLGVGTSCVKITPRP